MNDRDLHRGYRYEYKYECTWIDASELINFSLPRNEVTVLSDRDKLVVRYTLDILFYVAPICTDFSRTNLRKSQMYKKSIYDS